MGKTGEEKKKEAKRKELKRLAKAQMNHETLHGAAKVSKTLLGTIY